MSGYVAGENPSLGEEPICARNLCDGGHGKAATCRRVHIFCEKFLLAEETCTHACKEFSSSITRHGATSRSQRLIGTQSNRSDLPRSDADTPMSRWLVFPEYDVNETMFLHRAKEVISTMVIDSSKPSIAGPVARLVSVSRCDSTRAKFQIPNTVIVVRSAKVKQTGETLILDWKYHWIAQVASVSMLVHFVCSPRSLCASHARFVAAMSSRSTLVDLQFSRPLSLFTCAL